MAMDSVTLIGNLTVGPQSVCEGGFPSGILQIAFGLAGSCPGAGTKSAPKKFWASPAIASPLAFVTLPGVGAGGPVTQANFLYVRTLVLMQVRLTFADPAGGADVVSIVDVEGLLILEPGASAYLKLLEVKGSGSLEYVASGNL